MKSKNSFCILKEHTPFKKKKKIFNWKCATDEEILYDLETFELLNNNIAGLNKKTKSIDKILLGKKQPR